MLLSSISIRTCCVLKQSIALIAESRARIDAPKIARRTTPGERPRCASSADGVIGYQDLANATTNYQMRGDSCLKWNYQGKRASCSRDLSAIVRNVLSVPRATPGHYLLRDAS